MDPLKAKKLELIRKLRQPDIIISKIELPKPDVLSTLIKRLQERTSTLKHRKENRLLLPRPLKETVLKSSAIYIKTQTDEFRDTYVFSSSAPKTSHSNPYGTQAVNFPARDKHRPKALF